MEAGGEEEVIERKGFGRCSPFSPEPVPAVLWQSIPQLTCLNTFPQVFTSHKEIVKARPTRAFVLKTEWQSSPLAKSPLDTKLFIYLLLWLTERRGAAHFTITWLTGRPAWTWSLIPVFLSPHTCVPPAPPAHQASARRSAEAGCPLGEQRKQSLLREDRRPGPPNYKSLHCLTFLSWQARTVLRPSSEPRAKARVTWLTPGETGPCPRPEAGNLGARGG